jgi:ComF family protein
MIQDFKFHGRIHLAGPFGLLMLHVLNRMYAEKVQDPSVPGMIVPVPLHAKRHRSRGFNQAFLLSEHLVKLNRRHPAPHVPSLKTEKNMLLRCRWTRPQTGLTRDMRQTNIAGAFQVKTPEQAIGKHILLIDDVYTTGATVDECARILVRAGAARVDVLTLARV